jgi:hypothetical protein
LERNLQLEREKQTLEHFLGEAHRRNGELVELVLAAARARSEQYAITTGIRACAESAILSAQA